jgi:hypothetical protein
VLDGLLKTAGVAASNHDVPRALAALAEYVNRNPEHASTLPASPPLGPIQGEVRELLRRITLDAKTEAVRLIATAGELTGAAAKHPEKLVGSDALAVADGLVKSGQLVNYFRASDLSQAVIAFYAQPIPDLALDAARRAEPGKLHSDKAGNRPARRLIGRLWRKVPLLVLLMGWLLLGAAGGALALLAHTPGLDLLSDSTVRAAFEFWGVGFLGLVVFQFWITVRGILFRV